MMWFQPFLVDSVKIIYILKKRQNYYEKNTRAFICDDIFTCWL